MKTQAFKIAIIQEDLCVGCTCCIQACPVDAIIGAPLQMHTVWHQACVGCGLCIPACPVSCITMQPTEQPLYDKQAVKQRYRAKNRRTKESEQQQIQAQTQLTNQEKAAYIQTFRVKP